MQIIKIVVSLFIGVIIFSTSSFSQEKASFNNDFELGFSKETKDSLSNNGKTNLKYNSGGLGFEFEGSNSPNIGFTYRRFFKNSRYNLKASLFIGSRNYSFFHEDVLLFPTTDSTFIGITPNGIASSNYQRLEVGLEKKLKIWKLDFVAGADLLLGHRSTWRTGRVFDVSNQAIKKNEQTYFQYRRGINDSTSFNDINHLQTSRNYLTLGVAYQMGVMVDITPRLYASVFLGVQLQADILVSEKFDYKNDLYKEHLPANLGSSYINFDYSASFGLHYKF
jgi:hypothetical protein